MSGPFPALRLHLGALVIRNTDPAPGALERLDEVPLPLRFNPLRLPAKVTAIEHDGHFCLSRVRCRPACATDAAPA